MDNKTLRVIVTINDYDVHVSQPGKAGTTFDTGENGQDLRLALLDLAKHLEAEYEALNR